MEQFSNIQTTSGFHVYSNEYIQKLRDLDRDKNNPLRIIAQKGCQEKFLATTADITIFGGNRGPGKTFSLLMEGLKDIKTSTLTPPFFVTRRMTC